MPFLQRISSIPSFKLMKWLSRLIRRELEPTISALVGIQVKLDDLKVAVEKLAIQRESLIDEQTQGMLQEPIGRTGKSWMRMKNELEARDLKRAMEEEAKNLGR